VHTPVLALGTYAVIMANSRTATLPAEVKQSTQMHILLAATRRLSLSGLEAYYDGRFNPGEIKEMDLEFDTIVKATFDRIQQAVRREHRVA